MNLNNNKNNVKDNINRISTVFIALILSLVLAFAAGAMGCTAIDSVTVNDAANEAYLAEVNVISKSIESNMSKITKALKDKDYDTIDTCVAACQTNLDQFEEIAVPAQYEEAHANYKKAISSMNTIIKDYSSVCKDFVDGKIDASVVNEKTTTLQTKYQEAIDNFQKASAAVDSAK